MKPPTVREDGKRRVQCAKCKRTLAYADSDPVKDGKVIEIKCGECNELNHLIGRDEAA
jgi:phage FluMu protein Com